jgi:hypothetical protein
MKPLQRLQLAERDSAEAIDFYLEASPELALKFVRTRPERDYQVSAAYVGSAAVAAHVVRHHDFRIEPKTDLANACVILFCDIQSQFKAVQGGSHYAEVFLCTTQPTSGK